MADIRSVLRQHRLRLLQIDGVVGVGVGREGEEEVLKVLVEKRSPQQARQIPEGIGGYRVVVVETGPIRAERTRGEASDEA